MVGSGRRAAAVAATMLAATAMAAGCGGSSSEEGSSTTRVGPTTTEADTPVVDEGGRGDEIPEESGAAVPTSMVTISDPVNQAFSVQVPEGWDNVAYSNVEGQIVRQVVNSVSPDGGTVVFVGDPKLPSFWNPDTADPVTVQFAESLDSMELAHYSPADEFVVDWATEKFGELPGFELGETVRQADAEESLRSSAAQQGVQLSDIRVAGVRFSFLDEDGGTTLAGVTAATLDSGPFWSAQLYGAATDTGDLTPFLELAAGVASSRQDNPAFVQMLQQRHQDTMAMIQQRTEEMTRRHQANMQWIQDSANSHQQRMQSIWAANDASMARYYERMASGDVEHRQFLNYINDERTVVDSSGTRRQVDDSYQRYWMNPSTGQYYGGDINFGESQLRELGLNPSDFEEVQVVKG